MSSNEPITPYREGQAFRYDPLNSTRSFRLLSLQNPTRQDGPIELLMSTHALTDDQFPKYTALSYTWGSSDRTALVYLDGLLFGITPFLLEAIQHLRKVQQGNARFWWIDMMCINQDDDKERGHQVGMIRDIYQSADCVIAWLGPEASNSSHLMRALAQRESTSGRASRADELSFLSRPYWTRVWIVQELCAAKRIILLCGEETASWTSFQESPLLLPWTDYAMVCLNLEKELYSVPSCHTMAPYNLVVLRKRLQAEHASLGSLLTSCSQQAASDPRDRVFALLGLANDEAAREVVPDYSLSPCSVYCSAIRAMFTKLSKRTNHETAEAAEIREAVQQCHHEALSKDDGPRIDCDGIECGAWWCCLRIAIYDL
ncbi:hypothetical protein PG985_011541 [Apiospora marii]|uniref:uncharacterized protein n=1 Tax=Apiospora marii TaxID=335849 RepID=UPI00312E7DA6